MKFPPFCVRGVTWVPANTRCQTSSFRSNGCHVKPPLIKVMGTQHFENLIAPRGTCGKLARHDRSITDRIGLHPLYWVTSRRHIAKGYAFIDREGLERGWRLRLCYNSNVIADLQRISIVFETLKMNFSCHEHQSASHLDGPEVVPRPYRGTHVAVWCRAVSESTIT